MKKILSLAFLTRAIFLFGPYHPDLGNHLDWGIRFWEYGPKKFYEQSFWATSWPNQPPGTVYLWAVIAKIKEIIWSFLWWLNLNVQLFPSNIIPFLETKFHPALVKLPSVLAEVGIGWLIYLIVKRLRNERMAIFAGVIFLFNPITIYNSAIWGQTDGLINFFGLLAVYFFLTKKPVLGFFSFLLSLYFKISLIIFLPVIMILLFKGNYSFQKIFISLFLPIPLFLAFSFPFVAHTNAPKWLYDLYLTRIFGHQGNMLTANAFNLWALFFGIDLSRNDYGQFLFLSFRQIGILLFLISSLPLIFILLIRKLVWERVFFSLILIAFSAFLFLTNMHERYLYPIFPYLSILTPLGIISFSFFLLVSFIHLLNLYYLWFYPQIWVLVKILLWQDSFFVRLMSLFLLVLYFYLLFIFLRNLKSGKIGLR